MPIDDSYVEYVLDQLHNIQGVFSRKMFGGAGIYSGKLMFGLIADNVFYLKVDDANIKDYEKHGSKQFQPWPNKPMKMPYYEVPVDILEDREELTIWAQQSLDIAVNTKKK